MSAATKAFRTSKLETHHVTALNVLSSTPQTLAAIASALGITQDLAERQLSVLIDEGLAARTVGSRTSARYTAA